MAADTIPAQVSGLRERMRGLEKEVNELKGTVRENWDELKLLLEKDIADSRTQNEKRDSKIEALHEWKVWLFGAFAVIGIIGSAVGGISSALVINYLTTKPANAAVVTH